eukprot:658054-Rhodomonas_salina.1
MKAYAGSPMSVPDQRSEHGASYQYRTGAPAVSTGRCLVNDSVGASTQTGEMSAVAVKRTACIAPSQYRTSL